MNQNLNKMQVQTIINNAPKDVPTQDIIQGLINRGYKLEGLDASTPDATTESVAEPEKSLGQKLLDRVASIKQGAAQVKEGFQDANLGEKTDIQKDGIKGVAEKQIKAQQGGLKSAGGVAKIVGNTAGGIADVAETGIKKLADYTGVTDLVKYGLDSVPEPIKQITGYTFDKAGKVINAVAPEGTPQRDVLDATGNFARIYGLVEGAGLAKNGIGTIKNGVVTLGNGVKATPGKIVDATMNTFKGVKPLVSELGIDENFAGNVVKSVVAQTSGVTPQTQTFLRSLPKDVFETKFSKEVLDNPLKYETDTLGTISKDLEDVLGEKGKIGAKYGEVVNKAKPFKFNDKAFVDLIKNNTNLEYNPKTGFIKNADSVNVADTDLNKINNLVKVYKGQKTITGRQFMELRKAVGQLAYDNGIKTQAGKKLAKDIYEGLNSQYRGKIKGLDKLDAEFSPAQGDIDELSEYFQKDPRTGELTISDSANSKVANLLNRGKENKLARIEKYIPDIRDRLEYASALRNIVNAQGNMVGTYGRAGTQLGGVLLGGSVGGIPGAVAALIAHSVFSNPLTVVKAIGKFAK